MLKKYSFLICFISLTLLDNVQSDYFSSIVGLEDLLVLESLWVNNFENHIKALEESNNSLKEYLEIIEDFLDEFIDGSNHLYEDPLNAIRSIKRIIYDWKIKEKFVLNPKEQEDYAKNLTQILTELEITLPTNDDLIGAAKGVARLQNTYALNTEDIANGVLLNSTHSAIMTATECYYMGRYLYEAKLNQEAINWFLEARTRITKPNNSSSATLVPIEDLHILEFLGPAFFNNGNFKMAVRINEELLHKSPGSTYGLANKPLFENRLLEEREKKLNAYFDLNTTEPPKKLIVAPLYDAVCSGRIKPTPAEQRDLRCRYVSNNVPFCILAPFKMEELSLDPKIAYYHETIYENEIEEIIKFGEEHVERSQVGDITVSTVSDIRTGENTWLWYDKHSFLNAVSQRLVDITGLSLESAEPLQVATYGIGGHYGPHHDFSEDPDAYGERGNRIATALFYVSHVELGGGTAFPHLHLVVPPVRRSLVLWYNLHESLEPDYRTLHAGCPVLKGVKWVCNEWFHVGKQEFSRPCGLQLNGNKSIEYKHLHYYS